MKDLPSFIIADNPNQRNTAAQGCHVQGNVTRTTRAIFRLVDLNHWHRCFGRYARTRAMPIAIQHKVANDQYVCALKVGHCQMHK
jgi:hypothetical protein